MTDNLNKIDINLLNQEEKIILKKIYVFPLILEKALETYKPHLICNHLFELSGMINNWYGKFSVLKEEDLNRKKTMLKLCEKLKDYIQICLELLGVPIIHKL